MPRKPRETTIAVGDVFKAPAGNMEVIAVGLVGATVRWVTPSGNVYETWMSQDLLTRYPKMQAVKA